MVKYHTFVFIIYYDIYLPSQDQQGKVAPIPFYGTPIYGYDEHLHLHTYIHTYIHTYVHSAFLWTQIVNITRIFVANAPNPSSCDPTPPHTSIITIIIILVVVLVLIMLLILILLMRSHSFFQVDVYNGQ